MVFKWVPKNQEFALTVPLAVLCGVLLLALLVETLVLSRSGAPTGKSPDPAGPDAGGAGLESEQTFALPEVDAFSDFVDRPLFVEGRKPPPPEAEQPKTAEEDETTPLTLTLMGVLLTPRGELAILAQPSGKNKRVRKGGTLDGWKLVEIHTDRATLQRGEDRRDLPLMKPKPKKPQAPGSGPQGPGPGAVPPGLRGGPPQPGAMPPDVGEPEVEEMEDVSEPLDNGMSEGEE